MTTWLLYVGIAQCVFAMVFTLSKRPYQISDKIFFFMVLLIAFHGAARLFWAGLSKHYSGFGLVANLSLTFGPVVFFYTKSLVSEGYAFKKKELLHFLPFIVVLLITQCFFMLYEVNLLMPFHHSKGVTPLFNFYVIQRVAVLISLLFYSVAIYFLLQRHNKKILDTFTYTSNRITLNWLKWLLLCSYIFYVIFDSPNTLTLFSPSFLGVENTWSFWLSPYFHESGFVLFVYVLTFFGLRQPMVYKEESNSNIAQNVFKRTDKKSDTIASQKKYKGSNLKKDEIELYLSKLENYMEIEKPYLDGELTINRLAEDLAVSRHILTEIINNKLKRNFYTFVNEYRVKEAKQLLIDPENVKLTVLDIAFGCGFNTKSTFNAYFKKTTQMTPTEFRNYQHD